MWRWTVAEQGWNEQQATTEKSGTATRRRGPDPVTLLVGLLASPVAAIGVRRPSCPLAGFDPRWLLAAGARSIGAPAAGGSLRR